MPETATMLELDTDLHTRVAALALMQQRETRWVLLDAVREYVEREEKQQSCWDEAMQAWREFRQTGAHATQAEMETWFDQLEAGDRNAVPPACHK